MGTLRRRRGRIASTVARRRGRRGREAAQDSDLRCERRKRDLMRTPSLPDEPVRVFAQPDLEAAPGLQRVVPAAGQSQVVLVRLDG